MSPIPAMDLRPAHRASRPAWEAALEATFEQPHWILGPEGEALEVEFAAATGSLSCVGVSSGTAAIELSLRDARATGEVVTTALSAPFTAVAIVAAGARPRFADVDPQTLLLDPESASEHITRRTHALLPVHLYGQACDMRKFRKLASARGLALIQDACQAHGARIDGAPLTKYSDYVCYSFYPTKNLGCLGDGGAVTTDRGPIARRLRRLRDGGRVGGLATGPGINARLDEIQACYLRSALPHLASWNRERARLAGIYDDALKGIPEVRPVRRIQDSVHHLYVIRVPQRDKLRDHLARAGIGTGVHYPVPLHLHPAFASAGQKRGSLPNAERACREILSLPLWPGLLESEALRVVEAIGAFYR